MNDIESFTVSLCNIGRAGLAMFPRKHLRCWSYALDPISRLAIHKAVFIHVR